MKGLFKSIIIMISCLELLAPIKGFAIPYSDLTFNRNWMFHLGEIANAQAITYNDSQWRQLNLPHDWAIEGTFDEKNPSGTGGGALPGGIGWYRKTFSFLKTWNDKKICIDFDGVYMNSEVWINGHSLGIRPYGYTSFRYDLTSWIKKGKNVIAVRVDNSKQPNSRWYSGCGIYRNVHLVIMSPLHFAHWGIYVKPLLNENNQTANITVETKICNENKITTNAAVLVKIINKSRQTVASSSTPSLEFLPQQICNKSLQLSLINPHLWDTESPYLYSVVTQLKNNNKIIQTDTTSLGIRSIKFDVNKGFFLNGKHLKIKGVCLHHDAGCLGAVVNYRAIQRQLSILKTMGCNAIRCSHNPPAPEFLNLCDEMGFMVLDESFDMWRKKKTTYDYSTYFDQWYERDLTDMIIRDRNHPSIIMWSIGNEVLEQWNNVSADTLSIEKANLLLNLKKDSSSLSKKNDSLNVNSLLTIRLADIVRKLDDRPITAACNEPAPYNNLFRSKALDIIGYNYHNSYFSQVSKNFPGKPFIITESTCALETRGFYKMPSDSMYVWPIRWDIPFDDPSHECSSYDNCYAPWGTTHEQSLNDFMNNDFISGMFVWTGFDYIGEPTPYNWPARSSYFGIVDLAGFPKDSYYLYQSVWSNKNVLHIFPHWNWVKDENIDIWAYYNNADEIELYLNGVSQGIRRKNRDEQHVVWHLKYQPGTLMAISRKNGNTVESETIHTAGKPTNISMKADRKTIHANGYDLCYVTVEITDKNGNLCPWANNNITFNIKGTACNIVGVDNGSPISHESFKAKHRKAFYGKCLVVLENNYKRGNITLTASAKGLQSTDLIISNK